MKLRKVWFLFVFVLTVTGTVLADAPQPQVAWPINTTVFWGPDITKYNPGTGTKDLIPISQEYTCQADVSPDGTKIAYVERGPYIMVCEFDHGKVGKLLHEIEWGCFPLWADNNNLIYSDIFYAELRDGDEKNRMEVQADYLVGQMFKLNLQNNLTVVVDRNPSLGIPLAVLGDGTVVWHKVVSPQRAGRIASGYDYVYMGGEDWIITNKLDFKDPYQFIMGQWAAVSPKGERRTMVVNAPGSLGYLTLNRRGTDADNNGVHQYDFEGEPGVDIVVRPCTFISDEELIVAVGHPIHRNGFTMVQDYWSPTNTKWDLVKIDWSKWREGDLRGTGFETLWASAPGMSYMDLKVRPGGKDFLLTIRKQ